MLYVCVIARVCMCVYVCLYSDLRTSYYYTIHIYIRKYIHTCIYIHIHTYTYIHTHTYIYIYVHTHMYTYIHIYIHININSCIYAYRYIHTYIYVSIFVNTHKNTHTQTHITCILINIPVKNTATPTTNRGSTNQCSSNTRACVSTRVCI